MRENVVEICAGAGGQALGLERAGFEHALAVELDPWPTTTLSLNRPSWDVRQGDVADPAVWNPSEYADVALLAGGVPCPPFSVAGKQLGASDERDLFAWAVELAGRIRPRALLLENVRGLSMPRFSAYRQAVLDRLQSFGYVADWKLLQAAEFGVPQLRPRFVLVALQAEYADYFAWPEPVARDATVGSTLRELMGENGWPHADEWAAAADDIAPTIVGGSKKHGGADLGPTRAKQAWARLQVDGHGVADHAPGAEHAHYTIRRPRLTVEMVARLQGWRPEDEWQFAGRKTAQYRQIGNAFPPPLAEAIGGAIIQALRKDSQTTEAVTAWATLHDPIYAALREASGAFVSRATLESIAESEPDRVDLDARLMHLARDFDIIMDESADDISYRLGDFKAFTGQEDHHRHLAFRDTSTRARIS